MEIPSHERMLEVGRKVDPRSRLEKTPITYCFWSQPSSIMPVVGKVWSQCKDKCYYQKTEGKDDRQRKCDLSTTLCPFQHSILCLLHAPPSKKSSSYQLFMITTGQYPLATLSPTVVLTFKRNSAISLCGVGGCVVLGMTCNTVY